MLEPGVREYTLAAGKLFESLEKNEILKEGVIWWEQFLNVIINSGRSGDQASSLIIDGVVKKAKFEPFSKTAIIKVLQIPSNQQVTFVALARLGQIAVLDENIKTLNTYKIPINQYKSKKSCWATDACYSPETETLFIIASTRCLYLYNTSRIIHKLIQTVSGIWEIPECIHYTTLRKNEALILIGDNKGNILTYHFKQTNKSFFKMMPNRDGKQYYFWQDIINQPEWVDISIEKNVHNDVIVQVEYIPKSDCVISCSLDSRVSIAIRNRQPNRVPYIFVVEKGVQSFCLDNTLGMLATVSGDNIVRLWETVNTTRPIGQLLGHKEYVLDVILIANRRLAITYAENKELKVWDTETYACLQTMTITFRHVPYSKHILLNMRAIYLEYQTEFRIKSASQTSSSRSKMTTSNSEEYQQFVNHNIIKNVIIVNCNDMKMLRFNGDLLTSGDSLEEQISEESLSDKSEAEEFSNEMEIIDFINKTFSEEETNIFTYLKQKQSLVDFVREGTPYLALKLQQPDSVV